MNKICLIICLVFSSFCLLSQTEDILYYKQGLEHKEKGHYEESLSALNKAVSKNTSFAEAYLERGYIKMLLKQYRSALKDLEKGLEFSSNKALGYSYMAEYMLSTNDFGNAVYFFSLSLKHDSAQFDLLSKRAAAKALSSDFRGAIEDYTKYISLNDENFEAYLNRGKAKIEIRDHRGAIEDFDIYISKNKSNTEAFIFRGLAYNGIDNTEQALSDFNKALAVNPESSEAYYRRGILNHKLNNKSGGCLDLSRAGELGHRLAFSAIKVLCQ